LIGALHVPLSFVELTSMVRYFPITADYEEAERPDKRYDGMRLEVDVESEVWLSRQIILNLGAGLSWMNADYAKANYSVESQTDRLDVFEAKSGVHNIHASTAMIYMFTPRIGTALVGEGAYLLGAASDSPLTNSEFQPFGGIFVFYRF
jgi:outer membrane scaffolding protein for murein synthesis (MipA/OmpV family)